MSKISIEGNASGTGTLTIAAPNTNTNYSLSLPEEAGTITTSNSPYSTFRNRIINGNMVIDQRNAGASTNNAGGSTTYALDRWAYYGTSSSKFSIQQSTTAPTGFSNSILITSLAATTIGTNDEYWLTQKIEGFNTADLGWGTADAKTVTLSFWVRSSLTGTFGGSFLNSAMNYYYAFSYTINSANTWEQKTITVTGPTSGTWIGSTNGVGMFAVFGLSAGSTYGGATPNTWTSASYKVLPTGATNILTTNGATWYITGVQLEVGSVATPFERLDYGRQLIQCQRYFQVYGSIGSTGTQGDIFIGTYRNSSTLFMPVQYAVPMRTTPSFTQISVTGAQWSTQTQDVGITSFTISNTPTPRTAFLNALSSAAFSAGNGVVYTNIGTTTNAFSFNAEL